MKTKFRDVSVLSEAVSIYKKDGVYPLKLYDYQKDIFNAIVQRRHPRVHCITPTQAGKSMTVGAAVLTRCMTHPAEKWAIVAPSTEKAMIIMRYIIDFCMSSKEYKTQLDMEEGQKNRLKREISKKRIVFKNDSQIFVLSADSRNKAAAGEALMGFGCITAGHKIMTSKGEINIDDVVNNKEDVQILTFNHNTGKKEYKDILEYQKNPRADRDIYEIQVGEKKIECTEDHPVFVTGKGYIPAKEVMEGDEVYVN